MHKLASTLTAVFQLNSVDALSKKYNGSSVPNMEA